MRCLFCYDGPLEVDSSGKYYGTVINDRVFARYRGIADHIDVAIRIQYNKCPNVKSLIRSEVVSIHKIDNMSSLAGQFNLKAKLVLKNLVHNADFLIIRLPSFIGNICEKFARQQNKPYIIEMVGCPWDSLWNFSFKGKLLAPYMYFKTRKELKRSRFSIYVTNNFLQHRYPTDGKSVSCSNVEIDDYSILNKNKIIRYEKFSKSELLILGTCAAVNVPYKGQDCVIRAIPELLKCGYDVRYELVGGGSTTRLKELAKDLGVEDRVIFKGLLAHEEVFKWLQNVDIYIQPSKQEGLPRALIEAMNSTCFCLGARTGGIPELLPSRFIFSNKKNNYIEIAKLIEENISDYAHEAERNFTESKQYEKSLIQTRRDQFLQTFARECLCDE